MRFIFISISLLITLINLGCTREKKLIIGQYEITSKDIELRDKIVKIFYPNDNTPHAGQIQLEKSYIMAEVINRNWRPITKENILTEAERIERSSRDHKTLTKIQNLFLDENGKFDKELYLKVFILPTYVERIIGPEFFINLNIHKESHQRSLSLHSQIATGKSFEEVKKSGIPVETFCIDKKEGPKFLSEVQKNIKSESSRLVDQSTKPDPDLHDQVDEMMKLQKKAYIDRWFTDIIDPAKVGELIPNVVEYENNWLVLRMKTKKTDEACFDCAIVKKISFEDWLEAEKKKIKVQSFL